MKVQIIDCTLREGMQTRQCNFTAEQSAILAKKISAFGVDIVECGHPMISEEEIERVKAVVEASSVPVLSHARCRESDIDAVHKTGAAWIGLFASFNEISLRTKFKGQTKSQVFEMFQRAIRYAKSKGLCVRATIEDAGRTSLRDITELVQVAHSSGADRVCLADSVGILMPDETYEVFSLLRHEFPRVIFEYHVHNDLGLALANTMEAIRAKVDWISTSCNGIGERAGITDTFQLATLLKTRYEHEQFKLELAPALSRLVETYSRIGVSPLHPFVGINAFNHVAKLHQLAIMQDEAAYTIVDPKILGRKSTFEKDPSILKQNLFPIPFKKSSTELKYHRQGPGERYVMLDERLIVASPHYFIARKVEKIFPEEPGHVDSHIHNCDSVFIFLGDEAEYHGLVVEVILGKEIKRLESPATVFIPAGTLHSYRFINGKGTYINFVNSGEYHRSLLED